MPNKENNDFYEYNLTLIGARARGMMPSHHLDPRWLRAMGSFLESGSNIMVLPKLGSDQPATGSVLVDIMPPAPPVGHFKVVFDTDAVKNETLFKTLLRVEQDPELSILLTPKEGITLENPAVYLPDCTLDDYSVERIENIESGILTIEFRRVDISSLIQGFAKNILDMKKHHPVTTGAM